MSAAPLTPGRVIAIQIIRARKLLVRGMIARLMEDKAAEAHHEAEFARAVNTLPLALRVNAGDERRIAQPAIRRLKRVGVLAAHEWANDTNRSTTS